MNVRNFDLVKGMKMRTNSIFALLLATITMAPGAPEPLQITDQEALATSGVDSVYYATRLRGASNEKARHELNFRPRPLEWLQGRAVPTQHG
jgi:hypothetical protein